MYHGEFAGKRKGAQPYGLAQTIQVSLPGVALVGQYCPYVSLLFDFSYQWICLSIVLQVSAKSDRLTARDAAIILCEAIHANSSDSHLPKMHTVESSSTADSPSLSIAKAGLRVYVFRLSGKDREA